MPFDFLLLYRKSILQIKNPPLDSCLRRNDKVKDFFIEKIFYQLPPPPPPPPPPDEPPENPLPPPADEDGALFVIAELVLV